MSAATKKTPTTKTATPFPAGNVTDPSKLQPHPLSETVPGEMDADEFEALCVSIKNDGLRNKIILFEGKVLDGRARLRACLKVGKKPEFDLYTGTDAAALVMDNNLHRRQLSSMQKALVGARMHLREKSPLAQREAAAAVGVGVATLNLAVKLLESKNAPLIKRAENGNTTRTEINEILYDRAIASKKVESTSTGLAASGGADIDLDGDEDLFGDADDSKLPSNVVNIRGSTSGSGTTGTKPTKAGHRALETPPSRVAAAFKQLSEAERKSFVELAWHMLQPAIVSAGKTLKDKPVAAPKKAAPAPQPTVVKLGKKHATALPAKKLVATGKGAAKKLRKAA